MVSCPRLVASGLGAPLLLSSASALGRVRTGMSLTILASNQANDHDLRCQTTDRAVET